MKILKVVFRVCTFFCTLAILFMFKMQFKSVAVCIRQVLHKCYIETGIFFFNLLTFSVK